MTINVMPRAAQSIKKDRFLLNGSAGIVDNPMASPAKNPPMFEKLSTLDISQYHVLTHVGHHLPWKQIKNNKSKSYIHSMSV